MSSDSNGAVGRAVTAAEPANATAKADGEGGEAVADDADAQLADPWFAPGPKKAAIPDGADGHLDPATAEWFLRTGRAGLHPDSAPSYNDAAGEPPADHHEVRVTAAGAPPWAGEMPDASASSPPPWETGPWPGPAGLSSPGPHDGDDHLRDSAAASSAPAGVARRDTAAAAADDAGSALWPARTVLTVGLIPLVVPGLVVGVLSLRSGGGRAVRKASWLAIGASLAWAVIIVVFVAGLSGGGAQSCGGYPAAVHQAYEKALSDLSGNAPASTQAADLETAASEANANAAAAGQIGVRTALFAMANDMTQARDYVLARRPIPATLQQHLTDDGVVPAGSCAS